MQAYRQQYQQPQQRGQPATRRPGESDTRTLFPSQDIPYIARAQNGSVQPQNGFDESARNVSCSNQWPPSASQYLFLSQPDHATPSFDQVQKNSRRASPKRGSPETIHQSRTQLQQPVQPPMLHPHSTMPTTMNQAYHHAQMPGRYYASGTPVMYPQNHVPNHTLFHDPMNRQMNHYSPSFPGQVQHNPQQYAQHQAQLQQQRVAQQNAVLEHQMAQRRARKPTDKNMPDGIEDLIIGDGVSQYKELQDLERKLDYAMQRKRLDLQENYNRNTKRWRTLRIWIRNTVNNQPWQSGALEENAFDFNSAGDSTVRVTIEGKLLPEPEDEITAAEGEDTPKNRPVPDKFTKFFKHITVDFDKSKNNVPDPSWPQVEWKKSPGSNDLDSIIFQRKCDENININLNLTRDDAIDQRFRLSNVLAQTLEMEEADRAEVVMGLWEYIKLFNLQEDEDKRLIRCDDQLKQVSLSLF